MSGLYVKGFELAGSVGATFPVPVSAGTGLHGRKVNMSKRQIGYFVLLKNCGCQYGCDAQVLATPDL
jgi:hypothetical protein